VKRPLAALIAFLLCLAAPGRPALAQESAYRFEITSAGDSTFTFAVDRHAWVRGGLSGIAVDPMRRDMLVARFRVIRVTKDSATALITGQTTRITPEHVALIDRPGTPWYRQRAFWLGAVLGAVIGAVVAGR
jgi:hypothetical protein